MLVMRVAKSTGGTEDALDTIKKAVEECRIYFER
jgi:hypothetical protein